MYDELVIIAERTRQDEQDPDGYLLKKSMICLKILILKCSFIASK